MATTYDFRLIKGTTMRFVAHVVDSSNKPLDLTDFVPYGAITRYLETEYRTRNLDHVVMNCQVGPVSINGDILVEITPDMTRTLPRDIYNFTIMIKHKQTQEVIPVLQGNITLTENFANGASYAI